MPDLELPEPNRRDDMVLGTNRARLALAMERAVTPEPRITYDESNDPLYALRAPGGGVDNPYGVGVSAYEPNTVVFADEYAQAYGDVQRSKAKEAAGAQTSTSVDFTPAADAPLGGAPLGDATGKIGTAINAALELANRRVPYVWGGTTRNGVDCSGLIYYAFRAAGIDVKRYRAIDYGRMGQQVSAQEARPGDLVYWDNPNTSTDHIGIYLGNGKVVQAPQTGDVVKVSTVWQNPPPTYRRIFDDGAFSQVATPEGGAFWSYGAQGRTWEGVRPTVAPRPRPSQTITRSANRLFPNVEE